MYQTGSQTPCGVENSAAGKEAEVKICGRFYSLTVDGQKIAQGKCASTGRRTTFQHRQEAGREIYHWATRHGYQVTRTETEEGLQSLEIWRRCEVKRQWEAATAKPHFVEEIERRGSCTAVAILLDAPRSVFHKDICGIFVTIDGKPVEVFAKEFGSDLRTHARTAIEWCETHTTT